MAINLKKRLIEEILLLFIGKLKFKCRFQNVVSTIFTLKTFSFLVFKKVIEKSKGNKEKTLTLIYGI